MYSEKINKLMERCKNSPDDLDDIVKQINVIVKYVNKVISGSLELKAKEFRLDGAELRAFLEDLNSDRIAAHDEACRAIAIINSIASRRSMVKIFDFELEERNHNTHMQLYTADNHAKVAIFAGHLINELYEQGQMMFKNQNTVLDQATELGKQPFIKNAQDLKERVETCLDKNSLDFEKLFIEQNNNEIYIKLHDGSNELKIEPNIFKGKIYDVNIVAKSPMIEFDKYPSRDNMYFDIPSHLLKEVVLNHGGFELEEPSIDKLIEFSEEPDNNTNKNNLNKDEQNKDTIKPSSSNTDFNL